MSFRLRSAPARAVLHDPTLAASFGDLELGHWTLAGDAVNFLERLVEDERPAAVLEFGSGVSTACLAHFLARLHGRGTILVVSIDQSPECSASAATAVAALGLADVVSFHHVPLGPAEVGVYETVSYLLSPESSEEIRALGPELVFVDGPGVTGAPLSRLPTLPTVLPLLPPGARFVLDDALDDHGLETARRWRDLPGITVEGVSLVGHGLLLGRVDSPRGLLAERDGLGKRSRAR